VGKTTVAAHLAGAFALQGYDVILLDLDPDKNLRKLFVDDPNSEDETASLFVPPVKKGKEGSVITVLNQEEWSEREYKDVKIVICDCSPVLSENPKKLVEKFDYCIIPTTLNPLGVAKHGDVITRTFRHIREMNKKAEMFAVVNAFNPSKNFAERNDVLLSVLKKHVDAYAQDDPKCHLIHPDYAAIRRSDLLQYWGYHIVEGTRPQLAFREVAGRNFPRTDFLRLSEYLEDHTNIEDLKD
jgi:chromosome partitioning protein